MRLTDARFAAILADIATHGRAAKALRDRGVNPRYFWQRIASDEESHKRYARAKQLGMECLADEIIEIAEQTKLGVITTIGPKGTEVKHADMVERARLQIDSRKWLLSKLVPKKYGERTVLAGDPDAPLVVEDVRADFLRRIGAEDEPEVAPGMGADTLQ
jgi:hypothetical protein